MMDDNDDDDDDAASFIGAGWNCTFRGREIPFLSLADLDPYLA